jgi:capsular exopolysaccharide synthesis family protein
MNPLTSRASQSRSFPGGTISEDLTPWEDEATLDSVISGTSPSERRSASMAVVPSKTLDELHVDSTVLLAHHLTQEDEKNFHFAIQRYRLLSNRLMEVARNLNSHVFLITSALAEEGKTLVSANLAYALGDAKRKRTLLIDLDLRRYSLHTILGAKREPGDKFFLEKADWRESLWMLRPNLHALLTTSLPSQPEEALHSAALQGLLEEAKEEYDYILIDSAPLLLTADTHALLPLVDHALLVVRADHTPIACVQDAVKALGNKAIGCILNDVKRMKYESYYHSYYGVEEKS